MPSTEKSKRVIFVACIDQLHSLGVKNSTIIKFLNLGHVSKSNNSKFYDKCRDIETRSITKVDTLAMELMLFLANDGYDLSKASFTEDGGLIDIPRSRVARKSTKTL